MFSKRIIKSSRFLQMPEGSQNLYFHLALEADDDGVVETYPITQVLGTQPDTLKLLVMKGFIVPLNEDQVCFIKDWKEHNVIRADRKVDSIYKPLLDKMGIETIEAKPRSDVEDNSKRLGGPSTDGIGQDRIGKESVDTIPAKAGEYSEGFEKFYKAFPSRRKGGKKAPWLKWQKLTVAECEAILLDVPARSEKHWDWIKDDGAYIPAPEVYLNKQQWLMPIINAPASTMKPVAKVDRFVK